MTREELKQTEGYRLALAAGRIGRSELEDRYWSAKYEPKKRKGGRPVGS